MKKILIALIIVILLCLSIAGGYYYKMQSEKNSSSPKVATNITENTEPSKSSLTNINKTNATNQNSNNNETKPTATNASPTTSKQQGKEVNSGNTPSNNSPTSFNNKSTNSTNNTNSNSNSINNNSTNANATNNISNSGIIKIIPPTANINTPFPASTVIIENTTGKPISDTMLNTAIRDWILKWQFNSQGFCVATGENWASQWLNAIPNSALINAFIQANGEAALSKNITAEELNNGAGLYTKETYSKQLPFPFSTAQATEYIQQMLNEDSQYYGNNQIAKVVFHPGPNNTAGLYYVYTKQMLAKGYKQPFWYVYSNTGQATGV